VEKAYNSSDFPDGLILPDDHGYAIKVACSSAFKLDDASVEWNFVCPSKDPDVTGLPCIYSPGPPTSSTKAVDIDDPTASENLDVVKRSRRSLRDWLGLKADGVTADELETSAAGERTDDQGDRPHMRRYIYDLSCSRCFWMRVYSQRVQDDIWI
jgi:hypothetical protein